MKIILTLKIILSQIKGFLSLCASQAQAQAELKEDKKLFNEIEKTICDLQADLATAQVMRARIIKDRPSLVQKTNLNQKTTTNLNQKTAKSAVNWAI